MDFTLPDHIETLRLKTRDFVNQKIIPLESDISSYDKHENIKEDLLNKIRLDGCWTLVTTNAYIQIWSWVRSYWYVCPI